MAVGKVYLSANDFLRDAWRLAASVKASGWKPDVLVALWRGGATPGVALHEFFRTAGWEVEHLPLKCASYSGVGESTGEVVFSRGEEVFSRLRPGMRVLVVDDVFDTGVTARDVTARVEATGAEMKMACVYWKSPCNRTSLKPDFWTRDTGDDWIVFPHEMDGLSPDEIRAKDPVLAELLASV